MRLAPVAKVPPVSLVSPPRIAGFRGCREFLSLPTKRGYTALIGYRCERGDLRQSEILSRRPDRFGV